MKVDDVKIALKRSDGAHRSVVRALEDDRMVIFKGSLLLVEQEDGSMGQFHLGRYLTPQDGAWEVLSPTTSRSRDDLDVALPLGAILRDSAFFLR